MPAAKKVLGIFAKEPVPGQVKTRLSPPLSLPQAAELSRIALHETVRRMQRGAFDLVLCYAGGAAFFRSNFPGVQLYRQHGEDLGMRMAGALQAFFRQGYRQAALIGSDSPDLPLELVEEAFFQLERHELVLAPAHDGGYVLIGESVHHPQLFTDMPWSSPGVLRATEDRATAAQIDYRRLSAWDDLDDLAALQRLQQRSPQSRTAAYLRSQAVFTPGTVRI